MIIMFSIKPFFLTEEQKLRYCKEISDLQLTMAKQETIIEQQMSEIDALNEALSDNVSLLDSMRLEETKNREEFREIQKTISKGNDLVTFQSSAVTVYPF